jgi:transcription-repair coupling factor (superfamily II helicase)
LDEAVHEINGEPMAGSTIDASIDINVNAYIDDEYINTESQKIEMYKRIASIQDEQDAMDVEDELTDRYGDLPVPVMNLINVANIKVLAKECGFATIQEKNNSVIMIYREGQQLNLDILGKLMEKYKRRIMFTASTTPYITFKTNEINKEDLLSNIKILLQNIIELKNMK